ELALNFLTASRPYVQAGSPEQEAAEERQLLLNLAVQQAAHNPRHALQTAERELQVPGDLPFELINLLDQVTANDARSGAQLLHEIVGRLKDSDLSSQGQNLNFALSLLSQFSGNQQASSASADNGINAPLRSLADALPSATLPATFRIRCSAISCCNRRRGRRPGTRVTKEILPLPVNWQSKLRPPKTAPQLWPNLG